MPVLTPGRTATGRCWVYVRDDRPFGGGAAPAAMFHYSRDRGGEHPQAHLAGYAGLFQADAYGGYGKLYETGRTPGPILEAACWVQARRPFYVLADVEENARRSARGKTPGVISPIALEAVRRIDALFDIERAINGHGAARRRAVRQDLSSPLVADLETWMREQRATLSRANDLARAMDYMLKRWTSFARFLEDGRVCLSNNAAERALRAIALGRKSWLFAGSDRGGQRAAAMYSLIVKTLKYLYDFGDGWEHSVKIERIADTVPGLPYPVLLDATGRCPPEDVGGPSGYSDLLAVLANPDHERHLETTEWLGAPFDPLTCDVDQLAKSVDALARKWTRKPTAPRKNR